MTVVTGTVQDLGYDNLDGVMYARPARFRSDGQVVFAPERKPYKVEAGQVSIDLAPGPAVLELHVGSHARGTFEVVIPDQAEIELADLMDSVFPWEPEQISKFMAERQASQEALAAAVAAQESANGAADTAVTQAGIATAKADAAASSEQAAAESELAAATSEQAAAGSESAAASSEQAAASSESKALLYRDTAGSYKDVSVSAGSNAAQAAGTASSHAAAAAQARSQAEQFAVQASESRIVWRGDWDAGTAYAARDAVHHTGSTWRALRPNTGVPPVVGADWALMAERGLSYGDQIKLDTDGTPYLDIDPDYSEVPQAVLDRVADAETAAGTAGGEADRARAEADRARDYATAQDTAIAGLVASDTATRAELDARYLAGGVRESTVYPGLFEIGPTFTEDALLEGLFLIPGGESA